MNKKELRNFAKDLRKNINYRDEKVSNIYKNFLSTDLYKKSKTIFIYLSFSDEINTINLIKLMQKDKKTTLVPKIIENNIFPIEFSNFDMLEKNKYNILEPKSNNIFSGSIDITVTPGLLFDKKGYRLGYGGGFYDRFFKKIDTIRLALSFDEQIVEYLPNEVFDEKLDFAITENSIFKF